MTIELIQSKQELHSLGDEWNSLLSLSASHVPFLRYEYISNWWDSGGGGEWIDGNLIVIIWRGSDNTLKGIAPLFQVDNRLLFLGSYEISDYLDFISPPKLLPTFINHLFEYLKTGYTSWETLDLYNLLDNSPSLPILHAAAAKENWQFSQEILQPAPSVLLPNSWEEYINSLDDRYRQEIERKNHKADGYFLPIDWYITDKDQDLDQELDDFLELMANNKAKAAFLTEKMKSQMKNSALDAHKEGWLQLAFLTVGDIKAAGYLNFDFDGKIWVYNSGINSIFENISPGWVLLSRLISWSIQAGRTEFDFMRGNEPYKYHFGGKDKNVLRVQIQK